MPCNFVQRARAAVVLGAALPLPRLSLRASISGIGLLHLQRLPALRRLRLEECPDVGSHAVWELVGGGTRLDTSYRVAQPHSGLSHDLNHGLPCMAIRI